MRSASLRRSVYASRSLLNSSRVAGKLETCNADAYRIQNVCEKVPGVTRKDLIFPSFFRERVLAGASFGNPENGRRLGDDRTVLLFSGTQSTALVGARRFSTAVANPRVEGGRAQDPYLATEIALDAVVKIFAVSSSPNYFLPWQNKAQREATGSGECLASIKLPLLITCRT